MRVSVPLQEPFSYAIWPVILLLFLMIGILILMLISYIRKNWDTLEPTKQPAVATREPNKNPMSIKADYRQKLLLLEQSYNTGEISLRNLYQKLSMMMREFVQEMTGINVQNYTLSDIKLLGMPMLEELIAEYYLPEFATKPEGDVESSLAKAKKVIDVWN